MIDVHYGIGPWSEPCIKEDSPRPYPIASVFNGPHKLKYGLRLGSGVDFCIDCDRFSEYFIREVPDEMTVRGITFSYDELQAICCTCHAELYVPEVNDWNVDRRDAAFFKAFYDKYKHDREVSDHAEHGGNERMRTMTKHDLRDALIGFLRQTNDMVWDNRDSDRDLVNTAYYKQGVMEFFTFLEDRIDEEA